MSPFTFEPPTELVEIILSHLQNDIPALARCSLVDREWLSMCRRWMFEEISITSNRNSTRQARFHQFMDLFEKSTPKAPCTLNRHIQRLSLDSTFTPYQISGLATMDLPSLNSIRMTGYQSSGAVPPYLLTSVSTIFSEKVHSLDIIDTSLVFPTPLDLVKFICAFPNLQQLALGNNGFTESVWHPPSTDLKLSPRVTSLRWSQEHRIIKRELIEWLLDQFQQEKMNIKSLEYVANGGCNFFLLDLFAIIADNLEEINIHFYFLDEYTTQALTSPEISFPCLKSVRLVSALGKLQSITHWAGATDIVLGKLVSSLDAPQLCDLSLTLSKTSVPDERCPMHVLRPLPFEQFDSALSKKECTPHGAAALPSLRTVKFLVESCDVGRPCASSLGTTLESVETFEELASEFLGDAFPQALAERKVSLVVSRVTP